ncbi:BT_3928 family protein [Rapidithrix thailandica]|uniref:BT_3928 family protein n=1 Tax=Rapidithrix thailandica TaxID=413964 RepID=A0AAW9S2E5_9BACT
MKAFNKAVIFIIGALFIFSGLVKINDPVGTAIKFEEYFEVFSMDIASFFHVFVPYALPIAVAFCVLEMVLGVALWVGFKRKGTLLALLGLIVFFTFLTFYSAYFNKVTDCGCFGDAIPLTPWESFSKDVILLVLILSLVFQWKQFKNQTNAFAYGTVALTTILGFGLAFYAIQYLPFIDFRAYKIGNNIPQLMETGIPCRYVYIVEKDGQEYEFEEYPTDKSYTYKDMKILNEKECMPKITDYNVTTSEGEDVTQKTFEGKKLLIIVPDVEHTDKEAYSALTKLVKGLEGTEPMVLTADANNFEELRHEVQLAVPYYFADKTVLKTMVRSNPGVILIEDGTIKGKWHYNSLSDLLP